MNQFKSIQLLLLLLLASVFSCDKVRENPEPDHFLVNDLKLMEMDAVGGIAEFDVISANNVKQDVSVSFLAPKHGIIRPINGDSRFKYVAFKGFEGIDTVTYKICRTDLCKQNQIRLNVIKNPPAPCFPVYAKEDIFAYRQNIQFKQMQYKLPLLPGDFYCPKNVLKIDSYPSWVKACNISGDSIFFEIASPLVASSLAGTIIYSNCDTTNPSFDCKTRTLNINLDTSQTYCNQIFKVNDRQTPFLPRMHKSPRRDNFIGLVEACTNTIDMRFFDFYVSPNLFISWTHDENSCSLKKKGGQVGTVGPYFLHYIFRNKAGLKDTGTVEVKF